MNAVPTERARCGYAVVPISDDLAVQKLLFSFFNGNSKMYLVRKRDLNPRPRHYE